MNEVVEVLALLLGIFAGAVLGRRLLRAGRPCFYWSGIISGLPLCNLLEEWAKVFIECCWDFARSLEILVVAISFGDMLGDWIREAASRRFGCSIAR